MILRDRNHPGIIMWSIASVNNTLVNTFRGRAQAVVRPMGSGELKLTAESPGLKSAELIMRALD